MSSMRAWFEQHRALALFAALAGGALILLYWLNTRGQNQQAAASDASGAAGMLTYMGPADVTITENQYPSPSGQPTTPTTPVVGGPILPIGPGGVLPGGTPQSGPTGAPTGQPGGHEGGPTPVPTPHPGVFTHPHQTHTGAPHPAKATHPTRHRAPLHEHVGHPAHHTPPRHPGHGLTIPPGGHPFGGGDTFADLFYPTRD